MISYNDTNISLFTYNWFIINYLWSYQLRLYSATSTCFQIFDKPLPEDTEYEQQLIENNEDDADLRQ